MLKKFGPGTDYYSETTELDLKRTYIKNERQSLLDSSIIQLPKAMQQNQETLFMSSVEKARIRNETLLKSIQKLNNEIDKHLKQPDSTKFTTLKSNYWDMVSKLLPVWERELAEYEERKRHEHNDNRQDV
ncbi:unnamed protein product [Rotaria socialis]|uniref:Uncharacterized protein n=1 Tax=Rotaria socialis TaxID=392032 RepID=A0A818X945_9BILA|nr:unnamed protein product [Rotaria socialis]CAF3470342.1 unnamed protein product [Rotaria socialis]CAF3735614.1 unnamed protein product [Rotaria socialis]CAF4403244.1 unnamed protein product [Rotaria socialis]CAF4622358.1 unnamed protein product [Rotaria socialis]